MSKGKRKQAEQVQPSKPVSEPEQDPRYKEFKEDTAPQKNLSARKSYGEIIRENNEKRKQRILKMKKEKDEESE